MTSAAEWMALAGHVTSAREQLQRRVVHSGLQHGDPWGRVLGACEASAWKRSTKSVRAALQSFREVAKGSDLQRHITVLEYALREIDAATVARGVDGSHAAK